MSDQSTFAPWPPSRTEQRLRRKVEAVEALVLKHQLRDGRIPVCQILAAWLDIEETS